MTKATRVPFVIRAAKREDSTEKDNDVNVRKVRIRTYLLYNSNTALTNSTS